MRLAPALALVLAVACSEAAQPAKPYDDQPFLHVEHPAGKLAYIADPAGRQVILRGVNSEGLEDEGWRSKGDAPAMYYPTDPAAYKGKCPDNSNEVAAPLCEVDAGKGRYAQNATYDSQNDFAQMRAHGFNIVRLALSWSQLEPVPGSYKTAYLEQVAQVVSWAKEQGVYVILDMHEDQFSRFIQPDPLKPCPDGTSASGGFDGAPAWAVVTSGKAACAPFGQAPLSAAVVAAFDAFWKNAVVDVPQGDAPGKGLQDHWIGAMGALATRFKNEPAVIGYEIINEPQPGSFAAFTIGDDYLYPFYAHTVQALTGVRDNKPDCPDGAVTKDCAYKDLGIHDTKHLIFFEPIALRNLLDFSPQHSVPFSTYANLVYAPHTYGHVFTLDTFIGYPLATSPYPPGYGFAYATAAWEAEQMGTAVFVTEFGGGAGDDAVILAGEARAQERWGIGATLWIWKSNCSLNAKDQCEGPWSFFFCAPSGPGPKPQSGQEQPLRSQLMTRVWPRATAGRLLGYAFDPYSQAFAMTAADAPAVKKGDKDHETVVWIPAQVTGTVAVDGDALLDAVELKPDGSRLAWLAPKGGGTYGMHLGDAKAVATLQAQMAAEPALAPIDDVTARTTFKDFVLTAQDSTNADIAAKGVLIQAIAESVLKIPW